MVRTIRKVFVQLTALVVLKFQALTVIKNVYVINIYVFYSLLTTLSSLYHYACKNKLQIRVFSKMEILGKSGNGPSGLSSQT